jgi:hypothetical protein
LDKWIKRSRRDTGWEPGAQHNSAAGWPALKCVFLIGHRLFLYEVWVQKVTQIQTGMV